MAEWVRGCFYGRFGIRDELEVESLGKAALGHYEGVGRDICEVAFAEGVIAAILWIGGLLEEIPFEFEDDVEVDLLSECFCEEKKG